MPAKLTVITATYNKGERLLRTVESVLLQTMADFEYVVINDGSTDETEALLAGFTDDRLRVIHQKNKGLTPTLLETLCHVATPYIAIQGAGDISHPERFARQISYLDSNPDVVAVGCDREDRDVAGNLIKASSLPFRRLEGQKEAIRRNILNHGEVMFRSSAYFQAGGYRTFFKYAQDRDLWLRMIKYGDIVSVPGLLYTRITDPRSDVSGNPARTYQQAKLSHYAVHLAKGDLAGRWNNETIDPALGYGDFEAALGLSEKRAIARRIHFQVRATRMPPAEEMKRIEVTARVIEELAPTSWMAREIGLRKVLLAISPALFNCYFNLNAACMRLRRGCKKSRQGEKLSKMRP